MEERLQVRVEADISDLKTGLAQGSKVVTDFSNKMENIGKSVAKPFVQAEGVIGSLNQRVRNLKSNLETATDIKSIVTYNRRLQDTQKELNRLKALGQSGGSNSLAAANNRTAQSFQKLSSNMSGSNTVALEFNRIIQDAPFGMIGIGNNLQQLAGNFSNLSKQAGGSVPAIKAAFSALITGPNLALLAISAVTAGITAYNMGAFDFITANKDKKKSLEDLQKELDEYRQTLEVTQQQSIVGSQNAQQEITLLDALASQAQNTALSNEKRTEAVEELQKKYPSYLGNLTDEQIKTGEVGDELFKLRTNLLETAKAYAFIDKIRENSIALLDLESRALTRAQDILQKVNELRDVGEKAKSGIANPNVLISREARIREEISSILDKQTKDTEEIQRINQENLSLQQRTNQALEAGGNLVKGTADGFKKIVEHAGDLNAKELFDISKSFQFDDKEIDKQFSDMIKTFQEKIDSEDKSFVNIPVKVDFTPETLTGDAKKENDDIVNRFNLQKEEIESIFQDLGRSMQNSLSGAFEGAISGGENFFEAVVDGFKKMLAQLAAQLAASAVIKVLGMIIGGPAGAAFASGGSSGIGSLVGGLFGGGAGMRIGQTPAMGVPTTGSSSAGYKVNVNVGGVLRGNDIHLANQRNNRNFDRFY